MIKKLGRECRASIGNRKWTSNLINEEKKKKKKKKEPGWIVSK